MNEALAAGRGEWQLYESEDGMGERNARADVHWRPHPNGPTPAARKKGGEDAA